MSNNTSLWKIINDVCKKKIPEKNVWFNTEPRYWKLTTIKTFEDFKDIKKTEYSKVTKTEKIRMN